MRYSVDAQNSPGDWGLEETGRLEGGGINDELD